jgi:hypothetical protein
MLSLSRRLLRHRSQLAVAVRRFGDKAGADKTADASKPLFGNIDWTKVFAGVAAVGVIVSNYNIGRDVARETKEATKEALASFNLADFRLEDAKITPTLTKATYIERPGIEKVVKEAIYSSKPTHYHIVYGARGVGKSSVVEQVAAGRAGVVHVMVGSADNVESIISKFMFKVTGQKLNLHVPILRASLKDYTLRMKTRAQKKALDAKDTSPVEGDFIPAIIFEVERGSVDNKQVMQQVRSLAKLISDVCNCIIVISEANAVCEFGNDRRERYIYVDEMAFEETKAFLKLNKAFFYKEGEEAYKKIYDNIGGNATHLIDLLEDYKTNPLDVCIENIIISARGDLKAFELQPILKALKEHPEGVAAEDFASQSYKKANLAEPKNVGDFMKIRNAIVYRIDLKPQLYQLQSTMYKAALKTFEPVIDYDLYKLPNTKPTPKP